MISHQGIGIKIEWIAGLILREISEIPLIIFLIQKYSLSLGPSGDDVIKYVGKMNSGSSSHEDSLLDKSASVNTLLFMPDPKSYLFYDL